MVTVYQTVNIALENMSMHAVWMHRVQHCRDELFGRYPNKQEFVWEAGQHTRQISLIFGFALGLHLLEWISPHLPWQL